MIASVKRLTDPALIRNTARVTIGKSEVETCSPALFASMLDAGESPARAMLIQLTMTGLPYCDTVHFLRHALGILDVETYVRSQRPDMPNPVYYDRDAARQDAPVDMVVVANPEWFIRVGHLRLCANAGARIVGEALIIRHVLANASDPYLYEVARLMVPMCEYRGGVCHSRQPCGRYENANGHPA